MADFDVVVVGAGVVGLACAERLTEARPSLSVLVVERHSDVIQETSSRNSGVVHAGIYYPPSSLKSKLCIRGRQMLTERASGRLSSFRPTGKWLVASNEGEIEQLEALRLNAAAAGVELLPFDAKEVQRHQPALRVAFGLFSPGSGIVDPHELASSLRGGATDHGATLAMSTEVIGLDQDGSSRWHVCTRGRDGTSSTVTCRWLVNAAGLWADRIAGLAGIDIDAAQIRQYFCKGDYFRVAPAIGSSLSQLVYPLPSPLGLGVHLTLDGAGSVLAGPDAEYVVEPAYGVSDRKRPAFAAAIQRYLPALEEHHLTPAHAGIRPKLAGPGEPFRDFVIRHEVALGRPGLIDLVGIESPGLTASLAIAELVGRIVSGQSALA